MDKSSTDQALIPAPAAVRSGTTGVFLLSVLILLVGLMAAPPAIAADACPAILNHRFQSLQDQKSQSLCQWQGKVLLVVNTASYCGFTSQYDGLEKLYARLKDRGLVVVGFPSNDFGDQEPGSDREIAEFCRLTYGVKFPMFAKTTVVGKNANLLYAQLAKVTGTEPQWNFHKYLIDRSGQQVLSFGSRVKPEDRALLARIEEFLGKQ
jgi:glutathione peroxidase